YDEEGTKLVEIRVSHAYAGEDLDLSEVCGKNSVQLNAYDNTKTTRVNIEKQAFEEPASGCKKCDARGTQVKGNWTWTRAGGEPCEEVKFTPNAQDPDARFSAGSGTYTLTWTLENGCSDDITVTITDCKEVNFDGVDDHVDFDNKYNLNGDFSLEVWVKPMSISGTQT